ncbi:agmatinase [Nesterenkonia populi]|uniref:agmatinase n=1 Tax=Nesterenkonia populi TaxID=1591087 RepID=UPI0011BE3E8F|nr:agmatinase [Nesterenkonia populi]
MTETPSGDGAPVGPRDSTQVPRYAGQANFAHLPHLDEVGEADIAVVGIPFDTGVSFRPGARFGPTHVRDSSRLLRPYNPAQGVSPFGVQQVADAGDIVANPFDLDEALEQISAGASELLKRAGRVVTIGGDHTIAYPLLKTMYEKHGPVAVLHADAHLDTWDSYFGAPVTHGTPFRRASEAGFIDLTASAHLGIRGPLYGEHDLEEDERLGFEVTTTEFVEEHGVPAAVKRLRDRVGDRPVYVSIDIDVLDPAHAPGTGTPDAGGLTTREMLRIIRSLTDLNIVGADVVEVSPPYDHAQLTGIAAAHVVYELISAMAPRGS